MSKTSENEIIEAVNQFYITIKKVSAKLVISTLKDLIPVHTGECEKVLLVDFIIKCVSEEYGIDVSTLKTKQYLTGSDQLARKTCYILISEHTSLSQRLIIKKFNAISKASVSNALKYKHELTEKVKEHREFRIKYEAINTRINEYKSTTKK